MALKFLCVLAVLAAAEEQFLQNQGDAKQAINPELEPVSDQKFFKKDYPDDSRPGDHAAHHVVHEARFSHPYPEVQDSDKYDKDYVEDQNDDNGEWKAQSEYDIIRTKLQKEKNEMMAAAAKKAEEKAEWDKAVADEKIAEAEAIAAEKTENTAESEYAKAEAALEALKKDIEEAAVHTDAEVDDLQKCKEELEKAKAQLAKELAEKAAREAHQREKDGHENDAERDELAAMKTEEEMEKYLAKQQAERDAAKAAYEKEKSGMAAAEAELEAAFKELKKFQRADPDGGVYEVAKGGAHQSAALTSLSLVLIIALLK